MGRQRRKAAPIPIPIPSQAKSIHKDEALVMDLKPEKKEIVMEDEILDDNHHSSIYGNAPLEPWPFPAGPAIEVITVSIFNPHESDTLNFGEITTIDYLKKKYYFYYSRKLMLIKPGWNLLDLTRCPIAPVMGGHVNYQFTNTGGVPVFNDVYDMNKAIKRPDGTFFLTGDANSGYRFEMNFIKTPYAAIAKVEMLAKLASDPTRRSEEEYYELHGKVTANKFVCLDIGHDEALRLKYGRKEYVPIYRYVYAVPVDSKLVVEVELYNGTCCIMKKKLEVGASRRSRMPEPPELYFGCEVDNCFDFAIQVEWNIHEDFFDHSLQYASCPANVVCKKSTQPMAPGALVEVFSVFSGSGNSSAPYGIDLYGAIVICNENEKFNILAGNRDCPGKLLPSSKNGKEQFRTLSLKWPDGKWVVGEKFEFYLKLKDVEGKLVCVGGSSWSPSDSRYDCRLCDVFKGVDGYLAAVHYSVFKNGKKAKVSIECCNGPYSMYGSVVAKYKDYDYSSQYEEQCYQSILFKRSKEDALEVTSSQMSLLKSQVSAPSDCDELIVCVDLWVRPLREYFPHKRFNFNTNGTKSLPHKRFRFNTNYTKSRDMVWGTRDLVWGRLNVKVDWV